MRRLAVALVSVGLVCGGVAVAATPEATAAIAAAVADAGRPEADTARDAARKPAEIVAFAGVEPGDVIAELSPGGGYYTRILSKAVGPNGHVYALVPAAFAQTPGRLDAINALAASLGNVTVVPITFTDFTLEHPVDLVWTTENYHDWHNGPTANIAGVNASVFRALKPGGIFFVEDHAAADGAGAEATSAMHRMDPALALEELTAAGFTLDAKSDLLKNPDDPKNVAVREGSVQGHTERFAYRMRKPG
jgi:predicted methyltransferase